MPFINCTVSADKFVVINDQFVFGEMKQDIQNRWTLAEMKSEGVVRFAEIVIAYGI